MSGYRYILATLCLLLLPVTGSTQQGAPAAGHAEVSPDAGRSREITLDVAVNGKNGEPIRGLTEEDFTLLDSRNPQALTSFRAVDRDAGTPAPPIEVLLVLDAINADVLNAQRERDGVKKYLTSNSGKLPEPTSLIVLTDEGPKYLKEGSTDGNALAALLDGHQTGLRTSNRSQGSWGVSERFNLSLKALDAVTGHAAGMPGRKLMIWVSPGWPLLTAAHSDVTNKDQRQLFSLIVAASTQLRRNHITLYNVESRGVAGTDVAQFNDYQQYLKGVRSLEPAYPANLSLQVLATQTGGKVFNQSNDLPNGIAEEIAKGASDARAFYVLSFQGARAERPNEYHSLEIRVGKPGLTARTFSGYYAQP